MRAHWTSRSNKDFLYRVVADFIGQIEKKMEKDKISQGKLAHKLKVSKGRVSQVLNNPGNVSLFTVIKLARILGMKVSVVAYDDNDTKNIKGPINSEIFQACWERCEKPHDVWALVATGTTEVRFKYLSFSNKAWKLEPGSELVNTAARPAILYKDLSNFPPL